MQDTGSENQFTAAGAADKQPVMSFAASAEREAGLSLDLQSAQVSPSLLADADFQLGLCLA